jgi:para-aminobenzoate synthetase/4-amino-4-deoxychorismate lyase
VLNVEFRRPLPIIAATMAPIEKYADEDHRPDPSLGIFETILVVDDRPIELDAHLARLAASSRELYGEEPPDCRELVIARARGGGLGRLRLNLGPRRDGLTPSIIVAAVSPANLFPGPALEVSLEPMTTSSGVGAHKWADRDPLARAEARVGAGAVPLLVGTDGCVLEGSRANVFAVLGDSLVTPPLDGRILPGIARQQTLEAAHRLKIPTNERRFDLDELAAADEVFLTGSIRGVEPASALDGQPLPTNRTLTPQLATALRTRWLGPDRA